MNSKKNEANCPTAWSDNVLDASLMPKESAAKERMLHMSRLYLKVEATPMEFASKAHQRTDHSKEALAAL
jgi:hypothetical protein